MLLSLRCLRITQLLILAKGILRSLVLRQQKKVMTSEITKDLKKSLLSLQHKLLKVQH